jgi:hypothetical protein
MQDVVSNNDEAVVAPTSNAGPPLDLQNDDDLQFIQDTINKLSELDTEIVASEGRIARQTDALRKEREHRDNLLAQLRKAARAMREPLPPLYAASLNGPVVQTAPVQEQADDPDVSPGDSALLSEVFAQMPGAISKCYAFELQTVSQLTQWLNTGKTLRDIPGVGGVTAKAMEERLNEFKKRVAVLAG